MKCQIGELSDKKDQWLQKHKHKELLRLQNPFKRYHVGEVEHYAIVCTELVKSIRESNN